LRISEIQRNATQLSAANGWDGGVNDRFVRLIGEVGELAEELSATNLDPRSTAFELYDVIWNACDLANKLGIDLEEYFKEKQTLNQKRTW